MRGEILADWSTALSVTPTEMMDGFDRVNAMVDEIGLHNMADLDTSFEVLPDAVQRAFWQVAAQPDRRV